MTVGLEGERPGNVLAGLPHIAQIEIAGCAGSAVPTQTKLASVLRTASSASVVARKLPPGRRVRSALATTGLADRCLHRH